MNDKKIIELIKTKDRDYISNFIDTNKPELNFRYRMGGSLLQDTIKYKKSDITELLIQKGVKISNNDFLYAIRLGNIEIVKLLIKNGATINFEHNGVTPLMVAINFKMIEIVKFLIDEGANVNEVTKKDYTPLLIAIIFGKNIDIINLLIEKGANITYVNKKGETYLMLACWILNKDINININYYKELFSILLNKISVCEKNNDKKTCIDYLDSDRAKKLFKKIQNSINILDIMLCSYDKHFAREDENIFEPSKIDDHENIFQKIVLNFLLEEEEEEEEEKKEEEKKEEEKKEEEKEDDDDEFVEEFDDDEFVEEFDDDEDIHIDHMDNYFTYDPFERANFNL